MKKSPAKTSVRNSNLPSSLTTVTPFSRTLAMALFVLLPFMAFSLGMKYQKSIDTEPEVGVCKRYEEMANRDKSQATPSPAAVLY